MTECGRFSDPKTVIGFFVGDWFQFLIYRDVSLEKGAQAAGLCYAQGGRFWKSDAKQSIGIVVVVRKFSTIHEWIIGFETSPPSLHTSMTDGVELPKLRK